MVSSRLFPRPTNFAGIDVDADEGFGLIDNDIPAGFQPDFRLQQLVDFGSDPVFVENVVFLCVEFDPVHKVRKNLVHELHDSLILHFVVDAYGRELK